MSPLTAFISSKMREMRAERDLLLELMPKLDLGTYRLRPWVFEAADGAPASSASIREVFLDALQRSALYIGLIGVEYGEWTIDEFNHATRWGMDRHLYVKGRPSQARDPRLKVFLDRWNDVETGVTIKFFDTLDELTRAVTHALGTWTAEQVQARPPSRSARVLTEPEQVPDRAIRLFGRSGLVERIARELESGRPTLVCGFAGTGKTAVAAAVCETWLTRENPFALWLRCGFARIEDLVAAIARAFRREVAPHSLSRDEHLQLLGACLKEAPQALVVLDDCWNGEAVFAILQAAPRGTRVLVTARQRYPLDAIHEIDELPGDAALALLSSGAGRAFAEDEDADQLCEALSHHAFSIEIAGRALRVQRRTCRELLRQIAASPHELVAPLGFGERNRLSVKSLLNVNLDALGADQQLAFLAFGAFFAPTLTSEMVHQFLNDQVFWGDDRLTLPVIGHGPRAIEHTAELLRELEDHSLVRRTFAAESPLVRITVPVRGIRETETKQAPPIEVYQVHDLAYSFARSKASDDQRRHALDISLAFAFFYNEPAQSIFDILRPELDNFLGAAAWAMASGHPRYAERLSDLLAHSGGFLPNQGLQEHALKLLGYAKRSAELRGDEDEVIRNVVEAANMMMSVGRRDEAKATYERELERARSAGIPQIEQVLLTNLGALHLGLGEHDRAEHFTRQALTIARERNDTSLEADILGNLGAIAAGAGRSEEAVAILEDAARRHRDRGHDRGVAIDLSHLGDLKRLAGDWNAAAGHYDKALQLFERFAELNGVARTAHMLGICRLELGELEAASRALQTARTGYASLDDHERVAVCERLLRLATPRDAIAEFNLGGEMMAQGRDAEAEAAYRRAIALNFGDAANNLGALLMKQGRIEDARQALGTGVQLGSGTAAVNLGNVLERAGRFDEADRAYQKGSELGNGFAASCAGSMYYRQGRLEDAEGSFRRGIELRDGSAAYNLAVLIGKAGRHDEARVHYLQAIELGYGDAAANLGAILYSEGNQDEAVEVLLKGVALGSGMAAVNLGACYLHQERIADAEMIWRRGVELENVTAAQYLRGLLEDQGRLDEAEAIYGAGADGGDPSS